MSRTAATNDEGASKAGVGATPRWLLAWLGAPGLGLAAAWGFAEGTFFFVVPDLVPTLTALFCWRAAARQAGMVLAGSLLAGVLMFHWASRAPEEARAAVLAVPFVREGMVEKVREDYAAAGARGLLRGPFSGIPYKLYAVEAPGRVEPGAFVAWSAPARLQRFAGGVAAAAVLGFLARGVFRRRPWVAVALWATYWAALYAWYWSVI